MRRKKEKKGWRWFAAGMMMLMVFTFLAGCAQDEGEKVRELDATILSEEVLPAELKEIIEEKKAQPFQFTYSDRKNLFICIGYGKQETGGYSITLDDLYLTESEVVVSTTLLGPNVSEQAKKTATYPYIVIQTELVEQPVVFK